MATNINGNISLGLENSNSSVVSDSVHNASYADVLRKGRIVVNSVVPNNNAEELTLDNKTPSYDSEPSASETSDNLEELKMSAKSESLDSHVSSCSEAVEEFSSCAENGVASEVILDSKKIISEASSPSDVTEDQGTSEVLPLSSEETKTSLSSTNANKTPNESGGYSSGLSSEDCSSCEGEESEEAVDIIDVYSSVLKWKFRTKNPKLPETVTVLDAAGGGKVYLVGTAHFSLESQEDVAKTIRATLPDVVMVELCKSRLNVLSLDEATVLEESKNMNLEKIRAAIQQNGFMQGVLYLLLLNMSAHLTEQLGMAPGGEFRKAYTEARKIPGCVVHLGDRPIHITLQRALATLSIWQKIRIGWYMLTNREPISKQEVERCKQRDLLEETLAELTGEFPELSKVFVQERDTYLAYSLQMASLPVPSHVSSNDCACSPAVVVGVVGIGHVPGIVEKWGTVRKKDIPPIISIPEPSLSSRVIRKAFRYSFYGLVIYGSYRLIPKAMIKKPAAFIRSFFNC